VLPEQFGHSRALHPNSFDYLVLGYTRKRKDYSGNSIYASWHAHVSRRIFNNKRPRVEIRLESYGRLRSKAVLDCAEFHQVVAFRERKCNIRTG
jgi:hypothetical protein